MFDYDQRGILDATHLRFFTRRSLASCHRGGFAIRRIEPLGLPLDALGVDGTKARTLRLADRLLSNLWPTMFSYQFLVEATPSQRPRFAQPASVAVLTGGTERRAATGRRILAPIRALIASNTTPMIPATRARLW